MQVSRRFLALTAALLVGLLGSVLYLAVEEPDPTIEQADATPRVVPGGRDFMAIFDPSQPLLIPGHQTTVSEAAELAGYPIYRPAGETPSEVWIGPQDLREVGLRYGSTVVLAFSVWPPGTDTAQRYEQMAASWNVGYTTRINGNPAWVVDQDAGGPGSPPVNVIHVSIEDVDITLFGQIPMDELIDKAERLEP